MPFNLVYDVGGLVFRIIGLEPEVEEVLRIFDVEVIRRKCAASAWGSLLTNH